MGLPMADNEGFRLKDASNLTTRSQRCQDAQVLAPLAHRVSLKTRYFLQRLCCLAVRKGCAFPCKASNPNSSISFPSCGKAKPSRTAGRRSRSFFTHPRPTSTRV